MHWIQLNCLKSLNGSCTKPIFQIQISFRCWLSNWRCNATDDDGTERQAAATVASGHRKHISRLDESIFRTNRPQSTNWAADWYSVQRSALIASNNAQMHTYTIYSMISLSSHELFFLPLQNAVDHRQSAPARHNNVLNLFVYLFVHDWSKTFSILPYIFRTFSMNK